MENIETIKKSLKSKSKQVRKLKKKLRNRVSISKFEEMLKWEKKSLEKMKPSGYWDLEDFEDECKNKRARISFLEEIIKKFG